MCNRGELPIVTFDPLALIRGSASFGVRDFRPDSPDIPGFTGGTMAVDLTYTLLGSTRFAVRALRDIQYSFDILQPYYLQTGGHLTVTQRLLWKVEFVANADSEVLDYKWRRGATPVPGTPERADTASTVGFGFGIPLARGFKLVLGLERSRRNSREDPAVNYNRRRVISTITLGH